MANMENVFCERAYAKVSLSLAITGKRDNLHTIDMIVCPFRECYDEVTFTPIEGASEVTVGEIRSSVFFFDRERFLKFFMPKLKAIADKFGVYGSFSLNKDVPLSQGLGGSSASVVAALKAVCAYLKSMGKEPELDSEFLVSLGSDTACMLYGGVCRVQGVGDIVTPLPDEVPEDMSVMTVNGGSDSGKCYAEYDRLFATNEHLYKATDYIPDSVASAIEHPRNDLEKAAMNLNPNIERAYMRFDRHYKFVTVSGSGSAVVGIGRYDLFDLNN
ncbi:MAG: hypothetical protein K2J16_04155 [Clostridia bacterium]|nr:hypothetical protein [Clostridia bacterium]